GNRVDHRAYETVKRNLQVRAADRGYVDMAITEARIDVWPEDNAADLTLKLSSGERYAFGDVRHQQDFLDPTLIDGYIAIEPGTPFDRQLLQRAQTALTDSGYFGRIQLTADFDAASDGRIPVSVVLEPGTRIEYTLGAGASTDTGPRARAGFRNNRLNQRGHRVTADLNVSTLLQGFNAEYRMPLGDPRSEWRSFTGAVFSEATDTFETDAANLGYRRSKRLSDSWIRTAGVDLSYDNFEVADEQRETWLLVPSLTFDHKSADSDLYPNRGRRLTFDVNGTSDAIGSSTSFLQVTAQARWVRALGERTRLLARTMLGYTVTDDFDRLPPSVRFFAGGDESIRGFDLDSLGTLDANGDVVGGTRIAVASIEVETRLKGNFYGAAFVDAGNAFSDEDFDPAVGTGFGIKWRSPVGPVRFYVGFPVDEEDRDPRIHLRLGADL
ncbi:MAG: autotransporter assembly complex family protein, partial [Pseudomonadota bacterium]